MKLFREIEKVLWDYRAMKVNLEQLACAEEMYDFSCDRQRVMGGTPANKVEKLAVKRADYAYYIGVIDALLSILPETERRFVDLRYLCGLKPEDVAERIPCDPRTVYKIRERVLRKLAVAFGWRCETRAEPGHDPGIHQGLPG